MIRKNHKGKFGPLTSDAIPPRLLSWLEVPDLLHQILLRRVKFPRIEGRVEEFGRITLTLREYGSDACVGSIHLHKEL